MLGVFCTGSIFFLSLLDEELLISAESPLQQLKYSGQVHVRDLALMLEEILYFYRPGELQLSPAQLKKVLAEYDTWVAKHCVPIDPDVLQSVTALLMSAAAATKADEGHASSNSAVGYFQQHLLVRTMHFDQIAKEMRTLKGALLLAAAVPVASPGPKPSMSKNKPLALDKHESVRWSDIRKVLDDVLTESTAAQASTSGSAAVNPTHARPNSMSVAARALMKRNNLEKMRIAHATVPFQPFARWIHGVLKRVAEEQAEEAAFQQELSNQHDQ